MLVRFIVALGFRQKVYEIRFVLRNFEYFWSNDFLQGFYVGDDCRQTSQVCLLMSANLSVASWRCFFFSIFFASGKFLLQFFLK